MAILITTLPAKNETTWSVVDTVPAVTISVNSQFLRQFNVDPNWRRLRIAFKIAAVGSFGIPIGRMFVGIASANRGWLNAFPHCFGAGVGSNGDATQDIFWVAETSSFGNPPGQIMSYSTDKNGSGHALYPWFNITGSLGVQSGFSLTLPRPETSFSSSYASSSFLGNGWTNMIVEMDKRYGDIPNNYAVRTMWTSSEPSSPKEANIVNVPKRMFHESIQTENGITTSPYPTSTWQDVFKENNSSYVLALPVLSWYVLGNIVNESVYGPLNCLNVAWFSASPSNNPILLAIRDTTVAILTL